MRKQMVMVLAITALVMVTYVAEGQTKVVRAGDMSTQQWAQLNNNKAQDVVVEFRQGDEIPVSFGSEGDILETVQTGVSYVKVKRGFWIRLKNNDIQGSFDGVTFKNLSDMLSGSFSASAGANQPGIPVNTIQLLLKMSIK